MTGQKLRRCRTCPNAEVLGVVFQCYAVVGSKPRIHFYVSEDKTIQIKPSMIRGKSVACVNGKLLPRWFETIIAAMAAAVKAKRQK